MNREFLFRKKSEQLAPMIYTDKLITQYGCENHRLALSLMRSLISIPLVFTKHYVIIVASDDDHQKSTYKLPKPAKIVI